ncbi:MAG: glycerol-3-phosphate acyltransferase [Actinomycetota bacterium]|jgi:glycerol-3-phosphate acyltransferase PlsY|nr:glycerol-3-phosphate acyltransferase [Actinomycetota bacterium]
MLETIYLKEILIFILSFFLGSIPFCYIIAKLVRKKDLKKIGDKNPGGWNLVFNVSKWWGITGIILDISKGAVPYLLALYYTESLIISAIAGCLAVAGHNYSPFLKFNGGKGIATSMGFLLALNPFSIFAYGFGIVTVLFTLKSMIWGIISAITCVSLLLLVLTGQIFYLFMGIFLLIIILPKYIKYSKSFKENFKIDRKIKVKDLFTPKAR